MNKGIIAFVIIFSIMLIIAYTQTHAFNFKKSTSTTTVAKNGSGSTTTTVNGPTTSTTANYSQHLNSCNNFSLYLGKSNAVVTGNCTWTGGLMGLWVAAGNSGTEQVTIIGADNITYVNQISIYTCKAFFENITLPAQAYRMELRTGVGGGSCGEAAAELNTTTTPPVQVRNFVYNGDFGTGTYAGWNVTGRGFGTGPLNLAYANSAMCYIGQRWSGYNYAYFASTFDCGLATAPGNITSSPFIANISKPFLNFKIASQDDAHLYVEVLENSTPVIIAHYNTFNTSISINASSTFMNATLDLGQFTNRVLRIRVVAGTIVMQRFIAVGGFVLSSKPTQRYGAIQTNITYNFT